MNMKQSCKALICAIEGELDGRHCTEEQAAAILDHALPSLTEALARVEAERDEALEFMRINARSGMSYAEQRDTAQAQLAEAAHLLERATSVVEQRTLACDILRFLAKYEDRHAQAEQQEAQPTCQHLEALKRFHETCGDGEAYDVPVETMHQLAAMGLVDPAPEHGEHGFSMNAKGYAALSSWQEAQDTQTGEFQREDRYIVIKRKDFYRLPMEMRLQFSMALRELAPRLPKREYLVVESDWPEYEPTWAAIQARVEGRAAAPDEVDLFFEQSKAELRRARAKFPGDRIMTLALAEEFGELCKAVLDESAEAVRKEAVQVACMAARVVLDGDGSVVDWRRERGLDPLLAAVRGNER